MTTTIAAPAQPATSTPPVNETEFRVRFAETDMAGVIHHSNMFVWFENGRFALLSKLMGDVDLGSPGEQLFAPVTFTRVKFASFARFDDELILQTFIKRQRTTKLDFFYRLRQARTGTVVAIGATEHVVLTTAHRMLFKWPEHIARRIAEFEAAHPYVFTDGDEFDVVR